MIKATNMKIKKLIIATLLIAMMTGCKQNQTTLLSGQDVYADILTRTGGRKTANEILMPSYDGTDIISSDIASINITHSQDGYIIFTYTGTADKVIFQITQPDGTRYPYPINDNTPKVLSLVSGSGEYKFAVLEHTGDNKYVTSLSKTQDIAIKDEFTAFLFPNQYTDYNTDSECILIARKISDHSETDLTFVSNVFNYIIADITYDYDLAENIGTNYIPNPDATFQSKKGICFDYASLMASMLKSQRIPTKVEVGYAGTAYHAWISVYLEETGWVNNIIEFNGDTWEFMDPTIAANNASNKKTQSLIGDGTSYTVQYHY